jgi:3-isopropylmalate dehydrogenase
MRLTDCLPGGGLSRSARATEARPVIGILEGCGIGPEVIGATLKVLGAIEPASGLRFELRHGGPIGETAEAQVGRSLPDSAVTFCEGVFADGGAVLSGPGGGRYVYDLRRKFDLFCKFVPVRPWPELARAGRLRPEQVRDLDLLIVRDNAGGVYQGLWNSLAAAEGRLAEHTFSYSETQVRRIVGVAARAAAMRRGGLHLIVKEGGVPSVTALWREVGQAAARQEGIQAAMMNVDLAVYELIQNPARFDVIVTPNLFGDILADLAGVLVASRGVTFSGNYTADGRAVYQTNHGCAHDLAGTDTANPAGQILSLAMLLRESFGLETEAARIERSLRSAWAEGWRTADLAEPGCRIVGTQAMAERVAQQVACLAQ